MLSQTVYSQYKMNAVITITQTSSYCGGAKPPETLLKQLGELKPLRHKKFYIRKGTINNFNAKDFITTISDSMGRINIKLSVGKYYLVDERKFKNIFYSTILTMYAKENENYSVIDTSCLKQWIAQPDFVFEVINSKNKFSFNYHQLCTWNKIPRIQFKGKLPE